MEEYSRGIRLIVMLAEYGCVDLHKKELNLTIQCVALLRGPFQRGIL